MKVLKLSKGDFMATAKRRPKDGTSPGPRKKPKSCKK